MEGSSLEGCNPTNGFFECGETWGGEFKGHTWAPTAIDVPQSPVAIAGLSYEMFGIDTPPAMRCDMPDCETYNATNGCLTCRTTTYTVSGISHTPIAKYMLTLDGWASCVVNCTDSETSPYMWGNPASGNCECMPDYPYDPTDSRCHKCDEIAESC
jgi:hypothetical protein